MKRIFFYIGIFLMLLNLTCCKKTTKSIETLGNKEFNQALDNYCKYVDSVGFKQNTEYIYIEASRNADSTVFTIYLCGGAYDFLVKTERITDFITYKKYDIMLIGDYPNKIVAIEKNKDLNIVDDIVKIRYPADYAKYIKDKHSVAPLIYDYMNMILIFRNDKLVSSKLQGSIKKIV